MGRETEGPFNKSPESLKTAERGENLLESRTHSFHRTLIIVSLGGRLFCSVLVKLGHLLPEALSRKHSNDFVLMLYCMFI